MKFDPACVQGLCLGWFLQPGGKWRGDYLCVALEDLCNDTPNTGAARLLPDTVSFPLKAARQQALLDRAQAQITSGWPPIHPIEVEEETQSEDLDIDATFNIPGAGPAQRFFQLWRRGCL